ncbi:hypothetical protein PVAND_016075 [Polypedilum vanderplanki]|uniref:Uncharacterized protein n=1 Tax=Polypedilum vanderplanki TaxID=319348 RepID=A0A9J6BEJ5_POLVA|nr:hypothetical protein PVAND_016075 [Polypedilum vanderplanki]
MRPTLQTVPESLPADHVTQPAQTTPSTPAQTNNNEKSHQTTPASQSGQTPVANLKPRSSSSRVQIRSDETNQAQIN